MASGFRIGRNVLVRLLIITAILWIVWLPLVTSGNIRMDSDRMIHTPEAALTQYVQEGRDALVWLLQLFGLTTWHPVRSGVLFLVFFSIACWMLYVALRRLTGWKGLYPELFILLYGLSPIWAFHGYFVLQIAAIGFGIMLSVMAACLDVHFISRSSLRPVRLVWEIGALAVFAYVLLIYQSLIVCYIVSLLMLLFCWPLKGGKLRWRALIPLAARLLIALAVYLVVSRVMRGDMNAANMEKQIRWGIDPVFRCLFRIVEEAGAAVLMYTSRYFTLYTLGAVLVVLLLVRRRKAGVREDPWLYVVGLGMLLLPFGLGVLIGNVTVPRAQFALQMVAAFFPVCYLAETEGKHRALCAVCIAAVVLQAGLSLRLCYTDHLRNKQDVAAAEAITAELDGMDTSKPLAFVGVQRMEKKPLLTEKSDVFGRTFFEWIYDDDHPTNATPAALRLLTAYSGNQYRGVRADRLKKKAVETAKEMPSWPAEGSVREEEDMIVIKLSDP